ncbi:ethanolamine-phosphate cytidylyltransferase [Lachancea thermotolerans CBS 6340]|uniref:ethanolamine-phosphate cytidylyltransferase n=1 Tax=Lachancea thermotolerans (strain ATCC 56472 / CBS 6340 / NRRL Y-8284) TaxID=559295 RepID=C5DI07_LACTC|nr:KLTH0E08712p [Lachancea thermotolerans CBS 6340]CAR23418.1 KLTH0E08712p [Lachancea thermotolerans CBS 6340]
MSALAALNCVVNPQLKMENDRHRLWIDGCFDFTHHGHAGAILQARRLIPPGTESGALLCGVHNDEDILFNKGGKPVMNEQERYEHTRSNRWCSEIVKDAPYVTQPDVLDAHRCKFVVHGDDITTDANGEDCYQQMKDMGRFLVVKRTEGVSTTDIIQRILTGARAGAQEARSESSWQDTAGAEEQLKKYAAGLDGHAPWCYVFDGLISKSKIIVEGGYALDSTQLVYIEGDFDLFHVGHIEQLKGLRERHGQDARIIVGVRTTQDCFMTLMERALSVLSCRYVDGLVLDPESQPCVDVTYNLDAAELRRGDFSYLDKAVIVGRVLAEREHYVARNRKKGVCA